MRKIKFCQLWLLGLRWIRSWIGSRNLGGKISSSSDLFSVKKLFQNKKKGVVETVACHGKISWVLFCCYIWQLQLIENSGMFKLSSSTKSTIQLLSSGIAKPELTTKIGSIQNQTHRPHLPKPKKMPITNRKTSWASQLCKSRLPEGLSPGKEAWKRPLWLTQMSHEKNPPSFHYTG